MLGDFDFLGHMPTWHVYMCAICGHFNVPSMSSTFKVHICRVCENNSWNMLTSLQTMLLNNMFCEDWVLKCTLK